MCGFAIEWVRTCFSGHWRLFSDPTIITPGRYVRVPEDWPHYPGFHNVGSRDWTSDERDPWPLLGETSGRRTYYSGRPPQIFPSAVALGSPFCISHGERTPLPIVGREFLNGYDRRCFVGSAGPILPVNNPADITDLGTQIDLATISDVFYDNPTAAGILLQTFMGPGAVITVVPNSDSIYPGSIIGVSATQTVVIVSGTSNFQQFALQWLDGTSGIVDVSGFSTIQLWFDASSVIRDRMNDAGVPVDKPITFVGHSYGGATSAVLTSRILQANPDANIALLTFGMPRPGDSRLIESIRPAIQINYANAADPVPTLPPTAAELPWIVGLVPILLLSKWNQVSPPSNQIILFADGTQTPGNPSLVNYGPTYFALVAAAGGDPIDPIAAHEMKAYLQRLLLSPP